MINNKESLYSDLKKYVEKNIYPMSMPGHKRNAPKQMLDFAKDIYDIDVTEICGTDALYNADGILKKAMDYAKEVYQSDASFFLVNGSTCGVLSAIKTCVKRGENILFASNSHYSAYNAIELLGINPIYLETPKLKDIDMFSSVNVNEIKDILEKKEIKAIYITSPTYDGVLSDISSISKIAHKYNIPLIVDSAHGAHFTFIKELSCASALSQGADIVVESLHKTLPSLTQTAIIHIKSDIIDSKDLLKSIKVFQTSSPSYVFMSAIDMCIRYCNEVASDDITEYVSNLKKLRDIKLKNLSVFYPKDTDNIYNYDISKVIIVCKKINGLILQKILRQVYNIETEMAQKDYILALTTFLDKKEILEKLSKALIEIDNNIDKISDNIKSDKDIQRNKEILVYLEKYLNKQYNDYIYVYPPGIPIIKSGDILTKDKYEEIKKYVLDNYNVIV